MVIGGYLTWPGDPTADIILAHATGPCNYLGGAGLTITSVTILTPEPSTAGLATTGLFVLMVFCCDSEEKAVPALGSG